MSAESRIQYTAIAVFVLMFAVAFAQYVISSKVAASMETLKTVAARERLYADLLSMLRDLESGQRGFVITGNERFLEPYYSAVTTIPSILGHLEEGAASPVEKRIVEQTIQLTEQKIESASESIRLRRGEGIDVAGTMVATGIGKAQMDKLRKVIGSQLTALSTQRSALRESLSRDTHKTSLASGVALILNVALVLAMLATGRRLLKERMSASSQAEALSIQLARSVDAEKARNRDLAKTAEMLHVLESVSSLDQTAAVMRTFLPQLLPVKSGAVYLYRNSRDLLELHVSWGTESCEVVLEPEGCWALRRGGQHMMNGSTGLACEHYSCSNHHHLCVPLVSQSEVIGLLTIANNEMHSADWISTTVTSIAEQTALAIANVRLREALRKQSIIDPLTGLFNRRYLDETMRREISRSDRKQQPLSIVLIDIDFFKSINDTYGHDGGDIALREVAGALRQNTRDSDVVCRYGGEELVVLLSECDLASAAARAETMREAIAALSIQHAGQTLRVITASFGVATFPLHATSSEDLFKKADAALYRAKQTGRNRVLCASQHVQSLSDSGIEMSV